MKRKNLYITWGIMYAVCAALGFIHEPEGVLAGLMVTLSILFFLPPAMLLYRAIPREQWGTVRVIRNLSIASLALTLTMLVLNFLSLGASDAVGYVLNGLLIIVSSPMLCAQEPVVSLFLWACLLMVSLKYPKKK